MDSFQQNVLQGYVARQGGNINATYDRLAFQIHDTEIDWLCMRSTV